MYRTHQSTHLGDFEAQTDKLPKGASPAAIVDAAAEGWAGARLPR